MSAALCRKCRLNNEPPANMQFAAPPPEDACPVCWVRYGRYVPVCKTLSEKREENRPDRPDRPDKKMAEAVRRTAGMEAR